MTLTTIGFCDEEMSGRAVQSETITEHAPNGQVIGMLMYTIDGTDLRINRIDTWPGFRNTGISRRLIEQVLIQNPFIESISAELADTNFEVFKKTWWKTLSGKKAAMSTPLFRVVRHSGFDQFVTLEHGMGYARFVVKRNKSAVCQTALGSLVAF